MTGRHYFPVGSDTCTCGTNDGTCTAYSQTPERNPDCPYQNTDCYTDEPCDDCKYPIPGEPQYE
jgi:hypothetical protein